MIEVIEVKIAGTITLPPALASMLRPPDRFVVWAEGDTLHLKRLTTPSVSQVVAEAPAEEPPSTGELSDLIHGTRRKTRGQ